MTLRKRLSSSVSWARDECRPLPLWATFIVLAARMGFLPTAVDYEPRALVRAQASAHQAGLGGRVRWVAADVFALPLAPGSFDVVVDYGCLHHQKKSDWPRYRAALLNTLTAGGYFLLSVFSTAFRTYGPQERPWHLAHGAYRRFFAAADLRELFGPEFELLTLEEEREEARGFWHALMRRKPGDRDSRRLTRLRLRGQTLPPPLRRTKSITRPQSLQMSE